MNRLNDDLPLLIEEMPDNDSEDDSDTDLNCEMDTEIHSVKVGYQIGITQIIASKIYNEVGVEETEVNNSISVLPSPHVLSTAEDQLLLTVKEELGVRHDLDNFQVQAPPCGSGKLLVFYMAVKILRKKINLPNGVGLCLQPLNNILWDCFKISLQL